MRSESECLNVQKHLKDCHYVKVKKILFYFLFSQVCHLLSEKFWTGKGLTTFYLFVEK